jgi:hypothetical protein
MLRNILNIKTLGMLLMAGYVSIMAGCRPDEVEFTAYEPSVGDIQFLLTTAIKPENTTTFDLKPNGQPIPDSDLTTASGLRVRLVDTENLFANTAGDPVSLKNCGTVRIEVIEVPTYADLLARQVTTVAANGLLQRMGCAAHLRVFCDGTPIQIRADRTIAIQIPVAQQLPGMQVHYATPDANGNVHGWTPGTPDQVFWADWVVNGQENKSGYEILTQRTGWVAAQQPVAAGGSSFCVTLPPQFDAENTMIWLFLDDEAQGMTQLMMSPGADSFCADNIPTGIPVRVMAIAKTGPAYWITHTTTETGTNQTLSMNPNTTTDAVIVEFLQGL